MRVHEAWCKPSKYFVCLHVMCKIEKNQPAVPTFLAVAIPLLSKVIEPLLSAGSCFFFTSPKAVELNSDKCSHIMN